MDGEMKQNPKMTVPHSEIILNELRSLSLHAKLVLCACIRLFSKDKVILMDVFTEYKKLAIKYSVNWVSVSKVTEHVKELEMLGFLKCTYPPRGQGYQIKYIHIFEPAEIPKYVAILKEDLGKGHNNKIIGQQS